jgi:hypothetical protein
MESIKSFDIPVESIEISPDDVLRALGYTQSAASEPIIEEVQTQLSLFRDYISPVGGYVLFDNLKTDIRTESFLLGDIEFHSGKTIASQLHDSEQLAAIIATAGLIVREVSADLIKMGELLDGYIVDTIGSLAAESAADVVQRHIEEMASLEGSGTTNRLSPGYCGWNVSEQHKLFSLLPENFCGVVLTESALMIPIKSISAVIGIGKSVMKGTSPCSTCQIEKCYMRKS